MQDSPTIAPRVCDDITRLTATRGTKVRTSVYNPERFAGSPLCEAVSLGVEGATLVPELHLSPAEARTIAQRLLRAANQAEMHAARREMLDWIREQVAEPGFDPHAATFLHPDVVYVLPGEAAATHAERPWARRVVIERRPLPVGDATELTLPPVLTAACSAACTCPDTADAP